MHTTLRQLTILTALLTAVALAAPPAAASHHDPLPPSPTLDAAGVLTTSDGRAVDARLQVAGGAATLTVDGLHGGAPVDVDLEWSKARAAPHQSAAWTLTLTAETPRGALTLTGEWVAATVTGECNLKLPSDCTWWGAGPARLTGSLGGEALTLAGAASDTYCTQGHMPLNAHLPCGEAWPLPGPAHVGA